MALMSGLLLVRFPSTVLQFSACIFRTITIISHQNLQEPKIIKDQGLYI